MKYRVLILFVLSAAVIWPQDRIASIQVTGLKRTRETTIREIIKVKEGDAVGESLTEQVEQRLRKTGLFQDDLFVELIPGGEGQILSIDARDRWTLVGMPYFSMDKGNMSGGFFAYESNLFGTGKILVSSLSLGEASGVQALFVYQDPSLRRSDLNLSLVLAGGKRDVAFTDLSGEETWVNYSTDGMASSISLGYHFREDFLLQGALGAYAWDDEGEGVDESSASVGPLMHIEYDRRYYHELFTSGFDASLEGQILWGMSGDSSLFGKMNASFGLVPREGWLVKTALEGALTNDPFHSLYLIGGNGGNRTLPSGTMATDRYLCAELLNEARVLRTSWCSLTFPLYYEAGILEDYRGTDRIYHGAGGGMRVYLSKITIPALGVDFTYNFTTEMPGLSFFLGMAY